jgi:PAS domain S-box-containing protein
MRLAASSSRALADTALDSLREAVVVVDARHRHFPVVLANAPARRCLSDDPDNIGLIESPLNRWLAEDPAVAMETVLAAPTEPRPVTSRVLLWRFVNGETSVATDIKPLSSAPGQRLVMLSFAPVTPEPRLMVGLENPPFDLLILDKDLKVIYANAGAERACAAAPGGLHGVSALRLKPTAALPREVLQRALRGGHFHEESLEIASAGGSPGWFEVDVQPLKNAADIVGVVVLSIDVSERRLRGLAADVGDVKWRALTEHARDIITIAAPDGTLQFVSGGVRNSLGYTSAERETNDLFEHVHPDDQDALRAKYRQLVNGEIASYSGEFRVRHKDGSYRWLESSYTSALGNPLIGGVVINSRDITERKAAEGHLAQREELFRLAADAVDGVIFEWDVASGYVHRSRGVLEVLGMEPDKLAPTIGAWIERVHPRDFEGAKKAVALGLLSGRGWTTTYRIRDNRGRYRSLLERGLVQRNAAGDPTRVIGCCVDVSEIRRVNDLLAETQRAAQMGGWEYSYATQELTWTDEMYRIYETAPAEFAVSWDAMLARCGAESLHNFHQACTRAESAGGQFDLELEITTLKGAPLWVRMIGHVELLEGRPFRAFGSVQNVQQQKLAQIALQTSTSWLKLSMNMAHMHAWRWDRTQDMLEFAVVDGQKVHLPNVFPGMKKFMARVHPADRAAVSRAIDDTLRYQREFQKEFRLKSPSGRYRWYAATARPRFDGSAVPRGLVGVIQDVTARRESAERLQRSEELLRVTTANAADTLMLVDTDLKVRFINKPAAGMTIEQIIGRDIDVLLPRAACTWVPERLRQVLDTGETATYEFDSDEAGQARYFENRAVLVRDAGVATGISIATRDITERKNLEQEILDVSGRERQSIGRDLHDGLGQELTGVALMLRGLAGRVRERCPEALDSVNEIVGLVNQSIENARSLARGLLPVRTETGGLAFALRELAAAATCMAWR